MATNKELLMAKLTTIADATRAKANTTGVMTLDQIATAIGNIDTGGGILRAL